MTMNLQRLDAIERGYVEIERAAVAGERCPRNQGWGCEAGKYVLVGGLQPGVTTVLARQGRIRIEIYPHNFRVVEILSGPHAGKRTAAPPDPRWRPYRIIARTGWEC